MATLGHSRDAYKTVGDCPPDTIWFSMRGGARNGRLAFGYSLHHRLYFRCEDEPFGAEAQLRSVEVLVSITPDNIAIGLRGGQYIPLDSPNRVVLVFEEQEA